MGGLLLGPRPQGRGRVLVLPGHPDHARRRARSTSTRAGARSTPRSALDIAVASVAAFITAIVVVRAFVAYIARHPSRRSAGIGSPPASRCWPWPVTGSALPGQALGCGARLMLAPAVAPPAVMLLRRRHQLGGPSLGAEPASASTGAAACFGAAASGAFASLLRPVPALRRPVALHGRSVFSLQPAADRFFTAHDRSGLGAGRKPCCCLRPSRRARQFRRCHPQHLEVLAAHSSSTATASVCTLSRWSPRSSTCEYLLDQFAHRFICSVGGANRPWAWWRRSAARSTSGSSTPPSSPPDAWRGSDSVRSAYVAGIGERGEIAPRASTSTPRCSSSSRFLVCRLPQQHSS